MIGLFIEGLRNRHRHDDLFFGRNLNYNFFDDFFLNYLLNELGDFHYHLYYPWNGHYLFNNDLHWLDYWHLHYLVDYLFDVHRDLLDSVDCLFYRDDLLDLAVDDFGFGHYYWHLFFEYFWNISGDHLLLDAFDGDQVGYGHSFDHRPLDHKIHCLYHLLAAGDGHSFLHYFYDLLARLGNGNFNYSVNSYEFLLADDHRLGWHWDLYNFLQNLSHNNGNLNPFLNFLNFGDDGRHFNYFCFFNHHLFDSVFEDGFILFRNDVFSFNDGFLNNFFNFNNFGFNSRFKNDLIDESGNWHFFFHNGFFYQNFSLWIGDGNFFHLRDNSIVFNCHNINFFDDSFNNSLNRIGNHFFLNKLDYFLHNCRNWHYFFFNCFFGHYFLDNFIYLLDFVNRDVHSLIDEMRNLFSNDFVDCVLDWNHLCFFPIHLHNFLFDNFNLLDSWGSSVDFENIIDADYVHNLCLDHADYSLVDVQDHPCFFFGFGNFFQKGFKQNSEVEFIFP